jgi:hypothetical protein
LVVSQVLQNLPISCRNPPNLPFFSGSCSITEVIELNHRIRKKTKKEEQYHQGAQRITKDQIPQLHSFFVRLCGTFPVLAVKSSAAV